MALPLARFAGAALLLAVVTPAGAQRTTHHNFNSWYILAADVGLSERWNSQLDLQIRRSGPLDQPQAFFSRLGFGYGVSDAVTVGFGVSRSESYPFGEIPSDYQTPERRIFQQLQLAHAVGKANVTHRYRAEQRWQGRRGADTSDHAIADWVRSNRARYLLKAVMPAGPVYVSASNEVMVVFGENVGPSVFDQDRLAVAIGRRLNRSWRAEIGAVEHLTLRNDGADVELNHTITLGAYYARPWSK